MMNITGDRPGAKKHGMSAESSFEKEMIRYLHAHPEFFVNHPEVLDELRVPHASGGAVSLVEHQVAVLRDQVHQLRRKMQEFISHARDNEALSQRLHRLTLGLIGCARIDDIFATLYHGLQDDLSADAVSVRLFVLPRAADDTGLVEFAGRDPDIISLFAHVLQSGKPVCGRLKAAQTTYLFGEQGASIGSGALLPLGVTEHFGVLAVGSRDPHRFYPGMGTAFLSHLGDVVSRVIAPHVATA